MESIKPVFENGEWTVIALFHDEELRVYGVKPFGATSACKIVAKLAHEGDVDAVWTVMMCPNDKRLLAALAEYKGEPK